MNLSLHALLPRIALASGRRHYHSIASLTYKAGAQQCTVSAISRKSTLHAYFNLTCMSYVCACCVLQLTKGKVQLQKGLSLAQPKQETAKVSSDGKKVQQKNVMIAA
jgi:hypothetical protein